MPLHNSRFRIVHRTKEDPHGVEGYFIHEIYVKPDLTVNGWRAGFTFGFPSVKTLMLGMEQVIEAFHYEPIEYVDLSTFGFKLPAKRLDNGVGLLLSDDLVQERLEQSKREKKALEKSDDCHENSF